MNEINFVVKQMSDGSFGVYNKTTQKFSVNIYDGTYITSDSEEMVQGWIDGLRLNDRWNGILPPEEHIIQQWTNNY